ncbi:MAG: hypothetical protein J6V80_02065 [Clostridia bacterium]|nr:hypothetical protein [Clostridia bacterium]
MIGSEQFEVVINVVTAICFAWLSLKVFILIGNIFRKREHRVPYVRNYKKGGFIDIYIVATAIYFLGVLYVQESESVFANLIEAMRLSIPKAIDFAVLKFSTAEISALMEHSWFYKNTVYFGYCLVFVNTILVTISLAVQYVWRGINAIRSRFTFRQKLYLFGNNPDNIAIYNSDKKGNIFKRRFKVIIDEMSKDACDDLYLKNIYYIPSYSDSSMNMMLKNVGWLCRKHIFIINTGDDKRNILLARRFVDKIEASSDKVQKGLFKNVKVYVFGDPRYIDIYENIVENGNGCIFYVNKYQKIAMDFIDRYPISMFMNSDHIDYDSSLVHDNVDINVALIGFGKTNQQVFLTSVANNQFLTAGQPDPVLKPVKYYIFDKEYAENNKNLNHNYYRFKHEILGQYPEELKSEEIKKYHINPANYLDMPALPAEEQFFHLDINDCRFYNNIRDIVTKKADDVNLVIIAFGSDLENIDMAHKIVEKRNEWNLDNLYIFVKVRTWHKEQTLLENEGCYFIGNESDSIYNIDKILGDKIYKMARMRDEVYAIEYEVTDGGKDITKKSVVDEIVKDSEKRWYKDISQMERDSSLYCCLSLRSKLNMMGLDYRPVAVQGKEEFDYDRYIEKYAGYDKPCTDKYDALIHDNKKIVYYGLDFHNSRRKTMAIQEHHRWNSFMISRGIVPSTKDQIRNECYLSWKTYDEAKKKKKLVLKYTNGKNYQLRRHGNLTTFEGLLEFRSIVAQREQALSKKKQTPIEEFMKQADKIKYDYQILDDAHWLLSTNGYEIVSKTEVAKPKKNRQ